ncbi:hypothetical protein FHS19_004707 [Paenibacillus rhizosphaerae]|uniref:Uncharacterized protein n=1 Tax=Paenibacillus rhizosphaerae TaxID=297318 RepID=A0A839TTD7_9BACL|nr:hypothetical protein [Paenibacillus rhizosphaerae]MBB3130002.1 hypothetical protein [Paenibacillus rhizosphaerae]
MTMKNALTLRNLYILLCAAVVVLIGVKGYDINRKIDWVAQADQYYDRKDLISAEEWYQKAAANRSIRYKEDLIASRLKELEPITSMKQSLSRLDRRAETAAGNRDFAGLMNVYADLVAAKKKYMAASQPLASYYPKISAMYGISEDLTKDFKQFQSLFYQRAKDQLAQGQVNDNAFKWNLLAIPAEFYGGAGAKSKQLSGKFQSYDEALMTRMAGAGQYQDMLDWSMSMMTEYTSRSFKANWVKEKADSLTRTLLTKDVQGDQAANFAAHAKIYAEYMAGAGIKKSAVQDYITRQIGTWLKSADRKVKNHKYEEAIAIYQALSGYEDTEDKIKAAQLAWTVHDPVRLLQSADPSPSYDFVSGGAERFGGKAYAIGADGNNTVYFARMNGDETVQGYSSHDFPQGAAIRKVSIEPSLSTGATPVILVEADSSTRKALYAAYEVRENGMVQLFQFSADGYSVQSDKSLLVTNPEVGGGGLTGGTNTAGSTAPEAVYERRGDAYEFTGFQQDYTDIVATDLPLHPGEKVRFTIYVVQSGQGEGLAEMEGSYIKLRGNFQFTEGSVTVIGTYNESEEMYPDGDQTVEPVSVPVVDVERLE